MDGLDLNKSILPWLGKTGKMLHVFMVEKFQQHQLNLTFEQFIILRVLHEADGRPQRDLALVTRRHKASLTRIIGTLERKNLVARIPDPADARVNRIYLTTRGRKFYQSTLPALSEAVEEIQQSLSQNEIDGLIAILQKIQTNIEI